MQLNSHLNIVAGHKHDKSFLKSAYHKQPFKLADITEDKSGNALRLMITSSSPGVLDNDEYFIEILVEENACLHLTTQGYQRLFTMSNKASQRLDLRLDNNASCYFLPHPNVPHALSNFSAINNIHLQAVHNLIWSEVITCGRKLSGEEFQFTKYHNVTNIFVEQKLVVKENVFLQPATMDVASLGQLEGYTHQSTLIFLNNYVNMQEIANVAETLLSGKDDLIFGISLLPVNGLIFRQLGYKAEQLFNNNNRLAQLIEQLVDQHHTRKTIADSAAK
ncbi:MAG: urease accessory protein UreD [Ginsengibacter sp.]